MCYIMTDKEKSQKAKAYLSKIASADRLIQRLNNTVATMRSSLTSQNYELKADTVQTSGPKDTIAETIGKIIDLEREINQHIDDLYDLKREAHRIISETPDFDQQNVLVGRYIQLKKWEKLALEMNYSVQNLYKIHGKALLAFAERLKE